MTDHNDMPRPLGICGECQAVGTHRTHLGSGSLFAYCHHNMTGGVLEQGDGGRLMWHLFTPVTREGFEIQMHFYAARYAEQFGAPPVPLN